MPYMWSTMTHRSQNQSGSGSAHGNKSVVFIFVFSVTNTETCNNVVCCSSEDGLFVCEPLDRMYLIMTECVKCNWATRGSWLPRQWWSQPAWCKKQEEQKDERATHRWKTKTDVITELKSEHVTSCRRQRSSRRSSRWSLCWYWISWASDSYDLELQSQWSLVGSDASPGVWV